MLNKNDPLIAAVQKVMETNQAERNAVAVVNEKFGVTDRRALPRERQHEWDSAYKSLLKESDDMGPTKKKESAKMYKHKTSGKEMKSVKHPGNDWEVMKEALHPNQQKLDVHEPEKDELTKHDFKMLRAKKKTMEEAKKMKGDDPCWKGYEMIGMKNKGGKEVPNCVPVKEEGDPSKAIRGDVVTGGSSVTSVAPKEKSITPSDQSALKNKIQSIMKEAKTNPYAIGMAAVKKSTGDEPPMEKKNITKAHKIAKKIIAKKKMNEGFNNRHNLSVTASVKEQVVADQLNEKIGNPLLLNRAKARARIGDSGVRKTISGQRKAAPALDPNRNVALDNPTTQSNMALAQNPNIGGAGGGNYAAAQTRIPMAQKRAAAGDFAPAPRNTARQDNDLNAMRVASRDTNQDRPASAKYNSAKQMAPSVSQDALAKMRKDREAKKTGPSFEKTGRGTAPSISSTSTNAQTGLKPANVMSAKPSFEFSDKQREAAKAGKASIKDVESWAQSRGLKANPGSKEILRNYLNAAQNKTMKTDVKAGGTAATSTQTAAQSAEMKFKAGMAQRSGPSAPVKPTVSSSPAPNVQPARNSTLAAPSATAATTMATATKAAGQMAVDRMKAQNLAKSQTSSMFGGSVNKPKPFDQFQDKGKYAGDMRDTKGPAAAERLANPTFVPRPSPGTIRRNSTLATPSAMAAKPAVTSATNNTRRIGPDGQGGIKVGQDKPMGMSFTPKTTVDAVKKPTASVTPQMSQSVNSLQQKASMAGKERGLAPDFAKRELTRRQNIQTVKGA